MFFSHGPLLTSAAPLRLRLALVLALWLPLTALAQSAISDPEEWGRKIKAAESIAPLGENLFGDSTNFYDGTTSFAVTDIDLPGNNALPVRVTRKLSAMPSESEYHAQDYLGNWELDVPYIGGIFSETYGWKTDGSSPYARCTGTYQAVKLTDSFGRGWQYWRGNSVNIPGVGKHTLLTNYPSTAPRPEDGQTTKLVTLDFSQVRCGPTLANPSSSPGYSGEGFLLLAPDGTKYTFNWMTTRAVDGLARKGQVGTDYLPRVEVRLYATKVEDRFGNTVTYDWVGTKLMGIQASDGRAITFDYYDSGKIKTATAHGKIWQYNYDGSNFLREVVLPDNSRWQLPANWLQLSYNPQGIPPQCYELDDWNGNLAQTYVFTHPSGAVGEFTISPTRHGRTQVPKQCLVDGETSETTRIIYGPPILRDTFALTNKKISGPGIGSMVWRVEFGPSQGGYTTCGSACPPDTKWVKVTKPDGTYSVFTYGIRYYLDEGKLLRTQSYTANGVLVADQSHAYAISPASPPYPLIMGNPGALNADIYADSYLVPRTQTVLIQNGDSFNNTVNSFDKFARSLSVTRSNSTGATRTDATAYYDDSVRWVLGQVKSSTNNNTGIVETATDYDATYAKPWKVYSYGLLQATLSYNTDGTLASIEDGLTRKASLLSWKRGAPQQITLPDTVNKYVAVNDLGWITSTTDGRGYSTSYEHDGVGRLAKVTYPTGDPQTWAPRNITYFQLTTAEQGIPAGSWRARSIEGRLQISTYYDALWRPVLVHELDTTTNEARYVASGYDYAGRKTFESYPSSTASPTSGYLYDFDALGRSTGERSTDGTTLKSISYLSGNRRQVKDAGLNATITSYQAFDAPAYDKPTRIEAPEGQSTVIDRDLFGHINTVTQSGNGVSASRSYAYDSAFRLCRRTDPESANTLWGYDAASQIVWEARGQSGTACLTTAPTDAVKYQYDDMGRKKLDDYPGTADDVSYLYDNDGRRASIKNAALGELTFKYNRRGLLYDESMPISYQFDTQGHISEAKMPDGNSRSFAPDAWGRPTQIGWGLLNKLYVSGIKYHPNGVVSAYTLGNGLQYSTTLDGRKRLQTQTLKSASPVQSYTYGYNDDNDLKTITDGIDGVDNATLDYDGLHRLTSAAGAMWGSYGYTYDALNNLSTRTGPNALTYTYNRSTNRLDTVTGGLTRSYGYDSRGRPSSDGQRSYTWNAAEQLGGITGVATYAYLGTDRRVTTLASGLATEDSYDTTGTLVYSRQQTSRWVWQKINYLSLNGQALVKLTGTTPTYLHPDLLGSPRKATSSNASIAWQEQYDPYGKKLSAVNEKTGYTGHAYDAESGLTYAKARYYDADVGRFLTTDPVHFMGDPFSFNRYSYANNNPYKYTDPTGMCPKLVGDCGPLSIDGTRPENQGLGLEPPPPSVEDGVGLDAGEGVDPFADAEIKDYYARRHQAAEEGRKELAEAAEMAAVQTVEIAGPGRAAKAAARAARGSALAIPKVADTKLGNIVSDLYKGARGPNPIGTGSTADAIRSEAATGLATGGRFHSQKGIEYIRALENWQAKNPSASAYDRMVAESLKNDLKDALGK